MAHREGEGKVEGAAGEVEEVWILGIWGRWCGCEDSLAACGSILRLVWTDQENGSGKNGRVVEKLHDGEVEGAQGVARERTSARGRAHGESSTLGVFAGRSGDDELDSQASGMQRLLDCDFCAVLLYLSIQFILKRLLELL